MVRGTLSNSGGYARYVGRLGGLAIALGVGFAIAHSPASAWADDSAANSGGSSGHNAASPKAGRHTGVGDNRAVTADKVKTPRRTGISSATSVAPSVKTPTLVADVRHASSATSAPRAPHIPPENPVLLGAIDWARREFGQIKAPSRPQNIAAPAQAVAAADPPAPTFAELEALGGYVVKFPAGGNPAFLDAYEWSQADFSYGGQTYPGTRLDQLGTLSDYQCGGSCGDLTPYMVVFVTQDLNSDGVMGCAYDSCKALSAKPLEVGDIAPFGQEYGVIDGDYPAPAQYDTYVFVYRADEVPNVLTTLPPSFLPPVPPPDPGGGGDVTPPAAPILKSSEVTDKSIVITVSGGADDVGTVRYDIFRDGTLIASLDNSGDSYTDDDLDFDVTYVYTATAQDAAGNFSELSRPLSVTTYTPEEWEHISGKDPGWETAWENINIAVGWIPFVNDALAAVSTGIDIAQLAAAIASGDKAQIKDELFDLGGDAIQFIPFGKAIDRYLGQPLDKATEDLANYLLGLIYTGATDGGSNVVPEDLAVAAIRI
jgi:hypothetical protein